MVAVMGASLGTDSFDTDLMIDVKSRAGLAAH